MVLTLEATYYMANVWAQHPHGTVVLYLNGDAIASLPTEREPGAAPDGNRDLIIETVSNAIRRVLYTIGERQD